MMPGMVNNTQCDNGRSRAPTTRVRGYADWRPQTKTMAVLAQVQAVLTEYAAYLPLTGRQVFYRLVGAHGYDKTELAYSRLLETVNRARRSGHIPFEAIRDDGVTRFDPDAWENPVAFLTAVKRQAERFRLDRQRGQPARLFLLCEAVGMAPMLQRVADPFGVPVITSGGFDSVTAKHDLSRELALYDRAEVLHVGDHDPSGVHLFTSLAEDVTAFILALGGNRPRFTRLAVTMPMARELRLPMAPAKTTDRRAFDGETVQAEAIPPDVLSELVRQAIVSRQDAKTRETVLKAEARERSDLLGQLAVRS
jgi:hypothetical protein